LEAWFVKLMLRGMLRGVLRGVMRGDLQELVTAQLEDERARDDQVRHEATRLPVYFICNILNG